MEAHQQGLGFLCEFGSQLNLESGVFICSLHALILLLHTITRIPAHRSVKHKPYQNRAPYCSISTLLLDTLPSLSRHSGKVHRSQLYTGVSQTKDPCVGGSDKDYSILQVCQSIHNMTTCPIPDFAALFTREKID